MKISLILFVGCLSLTAARAQSVDWFTMDAAGLPALSANYLVNDTLGQADAGVSSSANYQILGGFWSLQGLGPSTGAPLLNIEFASVTHVRVWWPSPSAGYGLQSNANVTNPGGWIGYGGAVTDDGTRRSVLFPISSAPLFFRLKSPP